MKVCPKRTWLHTAVAAVLAVTLSATTRGQQRATALANDPPCQTLVPTGAGGPAPRDPSTLVIRWLGASNHEFAYRNTVVLMNAYYDRPSRTRPIGVNRDDFKRVDAIFIGHGHADHMADAPYVAQRTRARLIGGPPTIEHALKLGLPQIQAVTVRGDEVQTFNGFTVQAILGIHADNTGVTRGRDAIAPGLRALIDPPLTPEEKQHDAEVSRRGTSDPRVRTEGTIAYLFTFDTGFRLMFRDSAGPASNAEQEVMQRIRTTDVAFVAYQGFYTAERQIAASLPLIKLYRPAIFLPTHHDEIAGTWLDMATYPLFMRLRDELPETRSISPLYRTPICISTTTKEVFIGK